MDGVSTRGAIWRRLCWSLYWLSQGVWPTSDEFKRLFSKTYRPKDFARAGKPLAGGYFAILWVLRGDLEYMHETLGLNYFASRSPCFCCEANTDDDSMPWTDFTPSAAFLRTVWSNRRWLTHHPRHHPVFDLDGVGINNVCPDTMHDKHAGTDAYFLAGVLKFLTHHFLPGTPLQNLQEMVALIKAGYRTAGIPAPKRFTNIVFGMYVTEDQHMPISNNYIINTTHGCEHRTNQDLWMASSVSVLINFDCAQTKSRTSRA